MNFKTIGYGGRNPADFAALLKQHDVQLVVDVRLRPDRAAMGAYVRARDSDRGIVHLLSTHDIGYLWLAELGNVFLAYDDWRERYASLLELAGPLLTKGLEGAESFALMCCEKRVAECHRQQLADYLVRKRGWAVEHVQ